MLKQIKIKRIWMTLLSFREMQNNISKTKEQQVNNTIKTTKKIQKNK